VVLILVVLLTAFTIGLPAIWILQNQLDRQAWAQVEQGRRSVAALYAFRLQDIQNFAILTAQRPTLSSFISADSSGLTAYLQTLQESAGLSCIVVCNPSGKILVSTGESLPEKLCSTWLNGSYHYDLDLPAAYLVAHHPLQDQTGLLGEVFVCKQLDSNFVFEMSSETGLEHTVLMENLIVATSLSSLKEPRIIKKEHNIQGEASAAFYSFQAGGEKYYAVGVELDQSGLRAEVAINVSDIALVQRNTALGMVAAILGIAGAASLLGVVFSRQVSRPLEILAGSAETLKSGNLHQPVRTDMPVLEIAQVAQALEGARTDLLQTLTSLQSERDWSEHLLASIVEGIVTLDAKGAITFFSHGAERITGWSQNEVLGRPCEKVFQLVDTGDPFLDRIPAPGKRTKVDVVLAGGKQASLAITRAESAPTGAAFAEIALVFRDISEEEAVHRLLGHFLANVAHEFRTPLSALAASIELLLDQAPELSQEELNELLLSLHLGTLGLQTLVDNLLESASIEAGHFRISPRTADLGKIIADSIDTMRPLLDKYGQRLALELPAEIPVVRADHRRSVQVLVNLISNASRYGPADAEIKLCVTRSGTEVRVEVMDHGKGISREGRENLFRRFVFPGEEYDHSPPGAGLGLSVVKAIVEAHGGNVGVDDNPLGGSIFWFTLPLAGERS
jgi:signal transduction histidine kinase